MGRPKALLDWAGRPLVRAWCERLLPFGEVVVVDGAHPLISTVPPSITLVNNPDWATTGAWESLVRGAKGRRGPVLVTPVDTPVIAAEDIARLAARTPPAVLAWQGDPGHPVLVSAEDLVGSCPRGGLAALLSEATFVEATTGAVLANMNTRADYDRFSP